MSIILKYPAFLLLCIFVLSRILLINFFGVIFEYDWVFQMWHFIDIELLKTKMLESIYYFHYQPPIFNFFLGLIHKQNIIDPSLILRLFFYSLTYGIGLIIYNLTKDLSSKSFFPFLITTIFYIFPETIIYENWPIYTWTSSFLLVLSFYLLGKYNKDACPIHLQLFFISQLVLILTRSAFHPVFFISWFFVLLIVYRQKKTEILKSFLPSLIIFLLVCIKNFNTFGFFGVGSGLGFSLYKITPKKINEKPVEEILEVNHEFKINPVKSIDQYGYGNKSIPEKFKDIEVLNVQFKSTLEKYGQEFSVNLGHFHYLEIAKKYQSSAIKIIKKYPVEYLKRVFRGTIMFFKPTWDHGFGVENNSKSLENYINIMTLNSVRLSLENIFVSGKKPWPMKDGIPYTSYIFIPMLYIFVLLMMYKCNLINISRPEYLFVIFTVFYLMAVSNLIELAENDRYRVMIDPLVFLVGSQCFLVLRRRNNTKNN